MKNKLLVASLLLTGAISLFYYTDKKDTLFFSTPIHGRNQANNHCRIFIIGNASVFHHENDKKLVAEHALEQAQCLLGDRDVLDLYYLEDTFWSRDQRNREYLRRTSIDKMAQEDWGPFLDMESSFFCAIQVTKEPNGKITLVIDEKFWF